MKQVVVLPQDNKIASRFLLVVGIHSYLRLGSSIGTSALNL